MINNFVQIFSDMLSTGVLRTVSVVLFFMSVIASIDFILAFIFEYSNDFMSFIKVFLTKIFRYSIFFAIARYYVPVTDEFVNIIFRIGYLFFPSGRVPRGRVGLPDFDEIFKFLYAGVTHIRKDWEKLSWTQVGGQLTYLIIVLIVIFAIFLIIKEIIVNFVELKIIIALGVLLLPFNVFEQTKSIGSKLFHALLNSAGKLLVSICITGVTLQILQNNTFKSNGLIGVQIGNAISWTFLLGLAAYLVTNSRELGSMLINGTGSGNANNIFGQAMSTAISGGTAAVGGAVVGASAIKGGLSKGTAAFKDGKNMKGIFNAARKGMKEGSTIAKSGRLGKLGGKLSRGLQNTVGYASGSRSVMNAASDIWGATAGTTSEQVMHDGEAFATMKENLGYDEVGKASDYVGTFDAVKEAFKEARDSFRTDKTSDMPHSKYERYKEAFKTFREKMSNPNTKQDLYEKAVDKVNDKHKIHETRRNYMNERRYNPYTTNEQGQRVKKDIWNEDIGKEILKDNSNKRDDETNNRNQYK
ncbi:type IV secretion system protein [Streptobacillus moniliformis]|uniref:type IV secretion system protein n=1 Tax=Streptobacillus moniliformis TaxID=34105 RepID=UPI0007E4C3BB|nr:type IV secretion system protein [Streptobacillus moniliformis]QXW66308.1 type IV secretion system protein [Streptobacillus moniliformis]